VSDDTAGTAPAWLVDASIYIFRAWFSLPDRWHSPAGYPLNAVYGYTLFVLELLEAVDAAPVAFAFDESLGSCFRNALYPGYKASREHPDEALAFQLSACREITEALGLRCYSGATHEADDYIATLAAQHHAGGGRVTIVTRDKDLGQLLGEADQLLDWAAGTRLDAAGFQARFGVLPEQFPDYQGLVGDSIDDIPGVPGVGAKTAAALIQAFGDLETLEGRRQELDRLGLRGAARIARALEAHWELALLSRELARLDAATPGVAPPPRYRLTPERVDALLETLDGLGLAAALKDRCRRLRQRLAVAA
jgi:5'-3' exonuclease